MATISEVDFGKDIYGVKKFIIKTDYMQVTVSNYGASLIGLCCPDKNNEYDDILLGFDTLEGYQGNKYFGATVGRFANRIRHGKFTLDEVLYQLACNNGENHLHGGDNGFDCKVWGWRLIDDGVEFKYISPDGDEGYPGELSVTVTYTVKKNNELNIVMTACPENKPTIVNLTNHAFINLAGQSDEHKIYDHVLQINSTKYLPHKDGIPLGNIAVADGPFDFHTKPKEIGEDLSKIEGGYDHNYCLSDNSKSPCARVEHPNSGRILEIYTSQCGLQFYSGNFFNGKEIGKNGNKYGVHSGFCLEPQHYPDNVNQSSFPSSVIRPGEKYEQVICWKLSTKKI